MCICTQTHAHLYTRTHPYAQPSTHPRTRTNTHRHTLTHIHTCRYSQAHVHTHAHTRSPLLCGNTQNREPKKQQKKRRASSLTPANLEHHDRHVAVAEKTDGIDGSTPGASDVKRPSMIQPKRQGHRGVGKKWMCKYANCENLRHKTSDHFCPVHLSIYQLGNFEIYGKEESVLNSINTNKTMSDMWLAVERRLQAEHKLGQVKGLQEEVSKQERYYMRVIETWSGHKKADVDTQLSLHVCANVCMDAAS